MDAKEFIALYDDHRATLAAQTAAQDAYRGRDTHLGGAAKIREALKGMAPGVAEAAIAAERERPEVAEALGLKQALATAEAAHGIAAASLKAILAQRPAAVALGIVVAHGDPQRIAEALMAGADLVIPESWPDVFPVAARLVYVDGFVVVDEDWAKEEQVADLEESIVRAKVAAAGLPALEAQLAALKGA